MRPFQAASYLAIAGMLTTGCAAHRKEIYEPKKDVECSFVQIDPVWIGIRAKSNVTGMDIMVEYNSDTHQVRNPVYLGEEPESRSEQLSMFSLLRTCTKDIKPIPADHRIAGD